jgi:hypothetical protein
MVGGGFGPPLSSGDLMSGTSFVLPFLSMIVVALFGLMVRGQDGLYWGAIIGFGIGCAIVALIWLVFAILRRMVE